jgi:acyl-CoA synthetase (AMP-forming)/AMP-acid ligase II
MVTKSSLDVKIPDIDLMTLLFNDIPDRPEHASNAITNSRFLISAEDPTKSITIIQLKHLAKNVAIGLKRSCLQTGDHVMLVTPNYINTAIMVLGCIIAGGVFCAAQPDLAYRDYVDQFRRDNPKFLVVADEQPQRDVVIAAWQASGRQTSSYVWLMDDDIPTMSRSPNSCWPMSSLPAILHWSTLIATDASPQEMLDLEKPVPTDRVCMLLTTSGTTGLRKAAVYSHANLVASFLGIAHRARTDTAAAFKFGRAIARHGPHMRMLHTISISRAMGATLLLAMILRAKRAPTQVFYMAKTYVDMAPYLGHIQRLKITELAVAPFTLVRMLKEAMLGEGAGLVPSFDFSCLARVNVVGAPSAQRNLEEARKFFISHRAPVYMRVERSYGITEAASLVATWRMADEDSQAEGYQGRLEPNIEAKIVRLDELGPGSLTSDVARKTPERQTGEIWLRGPSFIHTYYENPLATKEAFSDDGWFRTGDVGYLDGDQLFVIDRAKDILKTPDNIPPLYIENILMEHPSILDVGVIGIYQADEELQRVRAYVVKRPGTVESEKDLTEWMQRQSANTAHLTAGVEFVDSIPRNNDGKLLRRVLKERAVAEYGLPNVQSLVGPLNIC